MPIDFYSARAEFGCFSNFSKHGIFVDGKYWLTTEHYFQAMKFEGTEHEELVRKSNSPKEAARMGRERTRPLRKDWESVKDEIMRRAVRKKFESHEDIRQILLGTGEEELVEAAPHDYYWGCGKDRSGKNRLGQILMEIRTELRAKAAV